MTMPTSSSRVAIVHDFMRVFGGAERVLKELHDIYPQAPIYTLLADPSMVAEHFPGAEIYTSSLQKSWLRHRQQFLLPFLPAAIEEFDFNAYDTVISSSGAYAHGVITGPDTQHICYCHSPMRYAWDWHAEYLSEHGVKSVSALAAASTIMNRVRTWDYVASKRVDVWLANSGTVSKRIAKFYGQPSQIIYPPVDTQFFSPGDDISPLPKPYVITVSRLSRYKRIDLLIEACHSVKLPLVIVGGGEDAAALKRAASGKDVTFTGRIDDTALRRYLQHARAYVTAVEEDFGIAPVEALSLGVPVVALGVGGVTETVVDGVNGRLFALPSVDSLTEALLRLDSLSTIPADIRRSAGQYSRQAFQTAIRNVVDHA